MYKTIVIDPPWTPTLGATWKTRFTDKARPQKHYNTLSLEELKHLQFPTENQAHLYIWGLTQHFDWTYSLMESYGFVPVTMLTWAKPGLGVGRFQCNTEHCLVGRKGSRHGNPFGETRGTWFSWPRGIHSEKPQEFYDLVQRISPGPYLDIFGRRLRSGWDVWGDEVGYPLDIYGTQTYS